MSDFDVESMKDIKAGMKVKLFICPAENEIDLENQVNNNSEQLLDISMKLSEPEQILNLET